jgi:hypothetical protein
VGGWWVWWICLENVPRRPSQLNVAVEMLMFGVTLKCLGIIESDVRGYADWHLDSLLVR